MSQQQIKAKFDAIKQKIELIENELKICRKILRGENP
jgi:hypothetical protein